MLMALLIVALATVTAITITRDQHLNLRRAQNLLHGDQAYLHALGVESWGRGVVAKDLRYDVAANTQLQHWSRANRQDLGASESLWRIEWDGNHHDRERRLRPGVVDKV